MFFFIIHNENHEHPLTHAPSNNRLYGQYSGKHAGECAQEQFGTVSGAIFATKILSLHFSWIYVHFVHSLYIFVRIHKTRSRGHKIFNISYFQCYHSALLNDLKIVREHFFFLSSRACS